MSFQQGLSGLNATAKSLEVIGNNIANANTIGAKASRAEFSTLFAASLNGTGTTGPGIGVQMQTVAQQFSQGNISSTENTMDLAINGRGFFMFQQPDGKEVYGRNGQLKLDRNNYVVNGLGDKLLAKPWDERANRAEGEPKPVQVPQGGGNAIQTGAGPVPSLQGIKMTMNFDAGSAIIPVAVPRVNFNNPLTFNYSTSQTVYDGQGLPLTLSYFFQKTNINEWNVYGAINGVPFDQASGVAYDPTVNDPAPFISVAFGADGRLLSTSATETTLAVNDPRVPSSPPVLFTALPFKFGGVTQFGAAFSISELKQDGYAFGKLTGINFDPNGVVKATYSNGRYINLFQLQLADFPNVQGLSPLGGNVWETTFDAGSKVVNSPGANSAGLVQSGALEESNIDLTEELVNMITAQRVYQANAQTIKTVDQVLQTLVNLR